MEKKDLEKNRWFILAHCFNMDGRAASQTITDRLPYLTKKGVKFVVLSAPTGIKDISFPHYQVISPAPSGIRFEMRFIIKNKVKNKTAQNILKALSAVLCLPFYALEKVFLQFDSQWSWFFSAALKGSLIIRKHQPALLYSTAGPPSTHLTAYILHKLHGIPWMAELHDPLILDDQHPKWHKYYYNRLVERVVCHNAAIVVYFTSRALENANRRHRIRNRSLVVRPGANPPNFQEVRYQKREMMHFGHFGSLDKTRNLAVFIRALHDLIEEEPELQYRLRIDIYGCELDASSRRALHDYPLGEVLVQHGRLEHDPQTGKTGRQQVMEAMRITDILLLLHGGEGSVSREYIPSKLYEYLLTGRPILGLVEKGTELEGFLRDNQHLSVAQDDLMEVKKTLKAYIDKWRATGLEDRQMVSPFTVEATVNALIEAVAGLDEPAPGHGAP